VYGVAGFCRGAYLYSRAAAPVLHRSEMNEVDLSQVERLVEDVGWKRFVNPGSVPVALENSLWSAVTVDRSQGGRVVGQCGLSAIGTYSSTFRI